MHGSERQQRGGDRRRVVDLWWCGGVAQRIESDRRAGGVEGDKGCAREEGR